MQDSVLFRLNAIELKSVPSSAAGPEAFQAFAFVAVLALLLAMLASEIIISHRKKLKIYSFSETVSNLAIYHGQQVVNFATIGLLGSLYDGIQTRFGLLTFESTKPLHWLAVVLMADLTYYVSHRLMHRVNLFLIPHSVHHQARDYNHISSFRLPWIQRVFMFTFYSVLAFVGVPTSMLVGSMLLHLLCGIFAHSGVIRRDLGVLEYVIVTPRSHFAHHGTNFEYLDRNFGGIFIVWDRLFGTYVAYDSDIQVELPTELSLDPVASNFDYFLKTVFAVRKERTFFKKISLLFGTPERMAAALEGHGYRAPNAPRAESRAGDRFVIIGLLVATVSMTLFLLTRGSDLEWWIRIGCAAMVFACSFAIGKILERRPNSPAVNLLRREPIPPREGAANKTKRKAA